MPDGSKVYWISSCCAICLSCQKLTISFLPYTPPTILRPTSAFISPPPSLLRVFWFPLPVSVPNVLCRTHKIEPCHVYTCLLHCTTSTRTLSAALHKRSQDGIQRVILMIFRYIFSSSFFPYHLVYCRTFLIFRSRHSNALLYLTFQVFSSVGSPSLLFYHWHSDFDFTL